MMGALLVCAALGVGFAGGFYCGWKMCMAGAVEMCKKHGWIP